VDPGCENVSQARILSHLGFNGISTTMMQEVLREEGLVLWQDSQSKTVWIRDTLPPSAVSFLWTPGAPLSVDEETPGLRRLRRIGGTLLQIQKPADLKYAAWGLEPWSLPLDQRGVFLKYLLAASSTH
jgi:hypothetical protein